MSFEVDILGVGSESKSGDAICIRFGNFLNDPSDQTVVIIDGGFADSGPKIVDRIVNTYGATKVDLVISTHPDSDHVSGLRTVLEELEVTELWMHTPWNRSEQIKKLAEDRGIIGQLSASKFKKSLETAYDLAKLATEKGVIVSEPFQSLSAFGNTLHVLSPHQNFYESLMAEFEKSATVPNISNLLAKAKRVISEVWEKDELMEPEADAVSSRNNSSVIMLAQFGDKNFLFTGDAGVAALNHAINYAESKNFILSEKIHYIQVPHHGSKRNVGPSVLDRIVGPIIHQLHSSSKIAFISTAAKGAPKHPATRVTNAFIRRGSIVNSTCGIDHYYHSLDIPRRAGWSATTPVEFQTTFDEGEV